MNLTACKKLNIPDTPGVYFFVGSPKLDPKATKGRKETLYIGKATSLRDRTKSYFSSDLMTTRGPMIVDMVTQSDTILW